MANPEPQPKSLSDLMRKCLSDFVMLSPECEYQAQQSADGGKAGTSGGRGKSRSQSDEEGNDLPRCPICGRRAGPTRRCRHLITIVNDQVLDGFQELESGPLDMEGRLGGEEVYEVFSQANLLLCLASKNHPALKSASESIAIPARLANLLARLSDACSDPDDSSYIEGGLVSAVSGYITSVLQSYPGYAGLEKCEESYGYGTFTKTFHWGDPADKIARHARKQLRDDAMLLAAVRAKSEPTTS